MSKAAIHSYASLLAEKQRLQALLAVQKQDIKDEITSIKHELNPIGLAIKGIGFFTKQDKSLGFFNKAINNGVDFLLKKVVLKNAGWVTKMVVPFIAKNMLSNFAARKVEEEMPSVKKILKKSREE